MIIDGNRISEDIKRKIKDRVTKLDRLPMLVAIQVGSDPASESFLRIKEKVAKDTGVVFELAKLSDSISTEELLDRINEISKDPLVSGIIVQLPLPAHIDREKVLNAIPKEKDPDVLSNKSKKQDVLNPVVLAIKEVIERAEVSLDDQKIVVIGEGELVGGPVTKWLRSYGYSPVVMTKDNFNEKELEDADIIISGAGSPGIIKKDFVKKGVVVIDAGTSESSGELRGDAEKNVSEIASVFTPVPGGIGPIAVAKLFENLIK